ncbi:hypothetical protein GCM10023323_45770 [Streptomyces thinghirensis]|uniref:Uncharacterized protein n=1 Tax=Streptomyces thinghirensis TaxID=551547 RepID=A0ABP9T6L4_9ACTN
MFSRLLRGCAVAVMVGPPLDGGGSRPWVTAYSGGMPERSFVALCKQIVIQSKEEA